MKPRFFIIVAVIALIVIIGIAVSASSSGRRKNPAGLITCTVNSGIGVDKITITNLNTANKPWTILPVDLPFSFNCTEGDTLIFNASATQGYKFNMWLPNSGIPYPSNPYTIKVSAPLVLDVYFTPSDGQP